MLTITTEKKTGEHFNGKGHSVSDMEIAVIEKMAPRGQ